MTKLKYGNRSSSVGPSNMGHLESKTFRDRTYIYIKFISKKNPEMIGNTKVEETL
jgi:hypothetical protein